MTKRGMPARAGSAIKAAAMLSLAALGVATGGAAARAEPGLNTWTTFLYEGPGKHYQVSDEIFQLTPLEVLGCADGWCHVKLETRSGYMLDEVVVVRGQDPANPPAGKLAQPAASIVSNPAGPCFVANQKGGNGGNMLTRFCEKQSP